VKGKNERDEEEGNEGAGDESGLDEARMRRGGEQERKFMAHRPGLGDRN